MVRVPGVNKHLRMCFEETMSWEQNSPNISFKAKNFLFEKSWRLETVLLFTQAVENSHGNDVPLCSW